MRTVAQGDSITLRVTFTLASGEPVDPDDVSADISAPDGSVPYPDLAPQRLGTGSYAYVFVVDAADALGTWTITWSGTAQGEPLSANETFEVAVPSRADTTSAIVTRLRRLLGERIPIGKTEGDTRFMDDEIADTYYVNGEDINKTMAELWLSKAAYLGDFVDTNESGTMRSLSQMQKAALAQANLYAGRVSAEDQVWASTYRAMAQSFSPYDAGCVRDRIRPGAVIVVPYNPQRLWTGAL